MLFLIAIKLPNKSSCIITFGFNKMLLLKLNPAVMYVS